MELQFIDWLRDRLRSPHALQLRDDAGVLRAADSVITTDMLMDGVHFDAASTDLRRIGRKALAASLSDLAAMAARPQGAVVSIAVGRRDSGETAQQVFDGLLQTAREFDVELIGGDTNCWDGPLVVNVAAWGEPIHGILTRSGGQANDALVVTGELGGSLLGHHLDFTPRVAESLELMQRCELHAGMDITDGLLLDLSRLAVASECGAVIDLAAVPISAAAEQAAEQDQRSALDHALYDGEDFELLLAISGAAWSDFVHRRDSGDFRFPLRLTQIGRLTESPGLFTSTEDGTLTEIDARGFVHGDENET